MSSFAVTLERLEIEEHFNADALELAKVGEYRAVVPKGVYKTGDIALYIPEQAILPQSLIEEIGLTGRLSGKLKDRVKAIKLRGALSQGIVCQPKALSAVFENIADETLDIDYRASLMNRDYAETLGITKWTPAVPAHFSGTHVGSPDLIRWIEVENIKKYPTMFEEGEHVVATEKVHGTCCLITYLVDEDRFVISSKGLGARNISLKEDETNTYWAAFRRNPNIAHTMAIVAKEYAASKVAFFGEVAGSGIQDLHYGLNPPEFLGFDIYVESPEETGWLPIHKVTTYFDEFGVMTIPYLYDGPYSYEALCEVAEGNEQISGKELHLREGVVVRSATERKTNLQVASSRAIAKFVSEAYLLRKGNTTEYE